MDLQQWELWSFRPPISQATVAIFPCFLGTCCGLNLAGSGLGTSVRFQGGQNTPQEFSPLGPDSLSLLKSNPIWSFCLENRIPDGKELAGHTGGQGIAPWKVQNCRGEGKFHIFQRISVKQMEFYGRNVFHREDFIFNKVLKTWPSLSHRIAGRVCGDGGKGTAAPPGMVATPPSREVLQFTFQYIHGAFFVFILLCQEDKEYIEKHFMDVTANSPSEGCSEHTVTSGRPAPCLLPCSQ